MIVVNYNGLGHLRNCFTSLQSLVSSRARIELIMIDNGSTDESIAYVTKKFPAIRILANPENNYARALNLGIAAAQGEYVGFVNNDVTVDPGWLDELLAALDAQGAAAAGGKILLKNGRINSVGIQPLPNFYWVDIGFNERDRGQYDTAREVEALCWASVLFRRESLDDVGAVDEDFVMYCEDVDYATRCRARGWKLVYTPTALSYHIYRGSSRGTTLAEYFCNRNRFLYLAKHLPHCLPQAVKTSHFFQTQQLDVLFECMPITIQKLLDQHDARTVADTLPPLCDGLVSIFGARAVDQLLARLQVVRRHRKMSIAIYDHVLQVIGGGQKYAATMAEVLQQDFDVTFIANRATALTKVQAWYRLDLSGCRLKVVPLPLFDARGGEWIDGGVVTSDMENPFDRVAEESAHYDVFVNANMLEKVRPLAPVSIFICHFPEAVRRAYFAVDQYTVIVASSRYGRHWIRSRWGLDATRLVYPAVELEAAVTEKEPLILSVARFEPGGSKKQVELIDAFRRLVAREPERLEGWRLVLAGGSLPGNSYLRKVRELAAEERGRIDVRANVSFEELQSLYARAAIFWHACGLEETTPELIEHFGMTTVEAMQNRCVPVVINGGGQREIVEHGVSGFLFTTMGEVCQFTLDLVGDRDLRHRLSAGAYERSQSFRRQRFEREIRSLFQTIRAEYSTIRRPDPAVIAQSIPSA